MKRKFFLMMMLSLIVLSGCALFKGVNAPSMEGLEYSEVPKWVYAPSTYCEGKNKICATGEGPSSTEADAQALNSLAAIFETQIDSSLIVNSSSIDDEQKQEVIETVVEEIQRNVEGVLKGAEIEERASKDGLFYSMATLNKKKTALLLSDEIRKLDEQIQVSFQKKRRSLISKLLILFKQRSVLNEKLIVAQGKGISTKMSVAKIDELRFQGDRKTVVISYSAEIPNQFSKWFESHLSSLGYELVKTKEADYQLDVTQGLKPQFLNVQGFKKLTYSIGVVAKNSRSKRVGEIFISKTAIGRSQADIFLKIRPELEEDIVKEFDKLNMQ